MHDELAYQQHLAASSAYATLPRGAIHADLFRDNVMFDERHARPACSTSTSPASTRLLFDIAVALERLVHRPRLGPPRRGARRAPSSPPTTRAPARERRAAAAAGADARRARCASGSRALWDLHLPRDAVRPHRARPDPLRARAGAAPRRALASAPSPRGRHEAAAGARPGRGHRLGAPGLPGVRAPAARLRRRCSRLGLFVSLLLGLDSAGRLGRGARARAARARSSS